MATTVSVTQADGVSSAVDVPFPYANKADVHLFVNSIERPIASWLTSQRIDMGFVPEAGSAIMVKRITPTDPKVVYQNTEALGEDSLNTSSQQPLYVVEELSNDVTAKTDGAIRVTGSIPTMPGDAASRKNSVLAFDNGGNPTVVPDISLGNELFHEELFTTTSPSTSVTLAFTPGDDSLVTVDVEGAPQTGWTRSGKVITLTGTPAGLDMVVRYYERMPFYSYFGGDLITATKYGIAPGSATPQGTEFQTSLNSGDIIQSLPQGDYNVDPSLLTGTTRATGPWYLGLGATVNGADVKHGLRGLFFGPDGIYAEKLDLLMHDGTFPNPVDDQATSNLIQLVGSTDTSTPLSGPKSKVLLNSVVFAKGAQHASAARFNLYNESTDGAGCVAVYGNAVTMPTALWSACLHGEVRHGGGTSIGVNVEMNAYNTTGTFIGVNINNPSGGPGMPNHPVTGNPKVLHPNATALMIQGSGNGKGLWKFGIHFSTIGVNPSGGETIYIQNQAKYHLHVSPTAVTSDADILLDADSRWGILINGSYTMGALRIANGEKVFMDGTGVASFRYESAGGRYQFNDGTTDQVSIQVNSSPFIIMQGNAVLGKRRTGWVNPSGVGLRSGFPTYAAPTVSASYSQAEVQAIASNLQNVSQALKALIDDCMVHGFIGA